MATNSNPQPPTPHKAMNTHRILTADKIVEVTTTIETHDRIVQWDDIKATVEIDDYFSDAPWENCDGLEHDIEWLRHPEDWQREAAGFGYSEANREYFLVTITDETVINRWGFTRALGESKQVWRERVAREKRRTIDQLVNWYANGWTWYTAGAKHGDCEEYLGGIDDEDYAREVAETELRAEVARQLEEEGYIVEGKPLPHRYSEVDQMRDKIHRQLTA